MQLAGRGGWVWRVEACGGVDGILARARQARLSHVLVKAADGADVWRQLDRPLVDRLHSAGLRVLGWQYCYGAEPEAEAAAAAQALALPLDGFVADVEAEYEGRWREAERYGALVRAACGPRLFAYAPLPVIDLHPRLPYLQLNAVCDAAMPQMYARLLGVEHWPLVALFAIWERWQVAWRGWGVPCPALMPIGEAFGEATAADVGELEGEVLRRGLTAHSYWALDHARPEHLAAMARAEPAVPAALTDPLDGIWARTERLAAIDHLADALAIQREVVRLKQALGLQREPIQLGEEVT